MTQVERVKMNEEINELPLPFLAQRLLDLPSLYCVADDVERERLVEQVSKSRMAKGVIVKAIAKATPDDFEEVQQWIDVHPFSDNAGRLLWLISLVDALELLPSDPEWKRPERLLRRLSRFGSFRVASNRMWACRFLADMPDSAIQAIPVLLAVVEADPDVRVRAWAAVALYCLGNREKDWKGYVNGLDVSGDPQHSGGIQIALDGAKASLSKLR